MTFKQAVEKTSNLQHAWNPGLQALRAQDRPHIEAQDTRRLAGSADVDAALQAEQPNAHRWDFGIGFRHTNRVEECVYWVEIHTASDGEVNVVFDKLRWLKDWLKGDGKILNQFEREFIWVSSGATAFTLNAPQRKAFAELGLQQKGMVLRIPNVRPN